MVRVRTRILRVRHSRLGLRSAAPSVSEKVGQGWVPWGSSLTTEPEDIAGALGDHTALYMDPLPPNQVGTKENIDVGAMVEPSPTEPGRYGGSGSYRVEIEP